MNETNNEILIIGPPKSGKSAFLAQLYGRLRAKKGKLTLTKAPKNIEAIVDTYERLGGGLAPITTPATENLELELPINYENQEFTLTGKDYGGEQVRDITRMMEYDSKWSNRAKKNDRWILFIRPSEIYHHYDLSIKGFAKMDGKKDDQPEDILSDQSTFIELLQALLHARGVGILDKINTPRLVIALTCWDELKTKEKPLEVLQRKIPLFYDFIESNWVKDKYKIIGLSAQGFPLDSEKPNDKYLDELPETFGYLILEDGSKDSDLTLLIEEALSL